MFGEVLKFVPSEADQEIDHKEKGELIEFPNKEKPPEGAVAHILKEGGAHGSAVYLEGDALAKAQEELADFGPRHEKALMAINKGMYNEDVKYFQELSKKVRKLKLDIKFTEEVNLNASSGSLEKAA